MSNIAPILRIRGRVRASRENVIPPAEALPERRDPETNRVTHQARDARPGYTSTHLTIDTDPGGFALVVFVDKAVQDAEGYLPGEGDEVDIPVRAFDLRQNGPRGTYFVKAYSFAGAVYLAEAKSKSSGGARALAATG